MSKASKPPITGSSKGRTADFESVNLGSNPSPITNSQPVKVSLKKCINQEIYGAK